MPIARAFDHFDDVRRWHVRCSFTGRVEYKGEKRPAMLAGRTDGLLLAGLAVAPGPATPPLKDNGPAPKTK